MKTEVEHWNAFIHSLVEARQSFQVLQKQLVGKSIERLPLAVQQALRLATVRNGDFNVALPRLVDVWRRSGGLETMLVEPEPEVDDLFDEEDD